jgi:mono/diheme cytochrome c family protein
VLLALTSSQKLELALVAAAFVAFALVSSLLIPHYRPTFPGRGLRWFLVACGVITALMLTTVVVLAKEQKPQTAAEEEARPTQTVPTVPGEATTPTETQPATPPPAPATPKGDPAAGKTLFTAQACGSCHTFTPAGASGSVGPDLDKVAADAQTAKASSLADYVFTSIDDPNAYVVPGFQQGVMPPFGQTLSKQQIADLVAFITQGS